jgi:hypothetical protein
VGSAHGDFDTPIAWFCHLIGSGYQWFPFTTTARANEVTGKTLCRQQVNDGLCALE